MASSYAIAAHAFDRKSVIVAAIVLVSIAWGIAQGFFLHQENLTIDVFDIGQGDGILITTPSGERIVIDGGPDATIVRKVARRMGFFDRTIDLVIATHPQSDHITGLIPLLERFSVRRFMLAAIRNETPEYAALRERVKSEGIAILDPAFFATMRFGADHEVQMEVLWPERSYAGKIVDDPNDVSIIVRLTYGPHRFLFTGDSTSVIEEKLLENGVDFRADVLKVGHHGSDTSTTTEFLQAVDPSLAVISVGRNNRFGHPSRRVLHRLERHGVTTYRTDRNGDVRIVSDGKTLTVKTQH